MSERRFVPGSDRRGLVRVLDADPDLAGSLSGSRLAEAGQRLSARAMSANAGTLADRALGIAGPDGFGLLMLDGVLAREILISDNVSVELLGAGDLLQPRLPDDPGRLLRFQVRWTVVEPMRVAVLDARFATTLSAYPEVTAALVARVVQRAHRLGVAQAIAQLNGVDRRVLALFWHLAERWGHITGAGTELPLRMPHRIVAQLVGARRPTVSTAIANLARDGQLSRRLDGGWVLHGEPVGIPDDDVRRVVPLRRRRVAEHAGAAAPGSAI